MPTRTPLLSALAPLASLLLAALLLIGVQAQAAQADDSRDEIAKDVAQFDGVARAWIPGVDEQQRKILDRIAAHGNDAAREALRGLAKKHGLARRGVAVRVLSALATIAKRDDVDYIIRYVERRRDLLLRESLSRILRQVKLPAARKHLRENVLPSSTPPIRVRVLQALGAMKEQEAMFAIMSELRRGTVEVRVAASEALGLLDDSRATPFLLVSLRDEDPRVRRTAARSLGMLGALVARPLLEQRLKDDEPRVREAAAGALGRLGKPESIQPLIEALRLVQGSDMRLEEAFGRALSHITGRVLGTDAEIWQRWWDTERDKPFQRGTDDPDASKKAGARYYGFRIISSRVVFVLDISRSMGWNRRLISAKQELIKALDRLPTTTRFNIIVYSDKAESWRQRLVRASSNNIEAAIRYINRQKPLNGTNTHAALMRALADKNVDTVFFLSDGNPSVMSAGGLIDPELILAAVRAENGSRGVRIHCIAIMRGIPPPAFQGREHPERMARFMEQLASDNDGQFRAIR